MLRKIVSLLLIASLLVLALPTSFAGNSFENSALNDPELRSYLEGEIYESLVATLNSDEYLVENVQAIYISQEYIDELAFNSRVNIYFGYTMADLEAMFQGDRYVFTLGEDGQTTVEPWVEYHDDTLDRIIRNVAIGTGVILVCVTVSVVSAGAGAPAMAMIFAYAADGGIALAHAGTKFGAISGGIVKLLETGNVNEALKAAAVSGSEGYKWGAIAGSALGGAGEAIALKGATLHGLTMNEAAFIQAESGYPLDVIKGFASMEQYEICKNAGLTPYMVNNKLALIRKIDLDFIDEFGRTNLQRMREGLAALDPLTGQAYELHHIGQEMNSTLAILTRAEHMQGGNNLIWHSFDEASKINRAVFDVQRQAFWQQTAEILASGV